MWVEWRPAFIICLSATTISCGIRSGGLECSAKDEKGRTLPAVLEQISTDPAISSFDLGELTPFEWDRLHVFSQYDTPELIEELSGLEYRPSILDFGVPEGSIILVFRSQRRAVCSFEHEISEMDASWRFEGQADWKAGISEESATFFVTRDSGRAVYTLSPRS